MIKCRLHRILALVLLATVCAVVSYVIVLAQDVKPPIREALNAGDTTRAIELINKDIQLDPTYNVNYLTLGLIYFQQHHFNRAKEQFALALDKKKKDFESSYYLGLTYLQLEQLDSARAIFNEATQKAKGLDRARFLDGYGQVMIAKDSLDAAQRALIEAVRLDSTNSLYMIHLGNAYFKAGVPSLAVSNYEHALKTDTGSTEVYYNWAEACLEMKDYTCALEKLRVVLQKDSTHAEAWARAGGIYFKAALSSTTRDDRNNRFKEALGSYKKYLDLSKAPADSANVRAYFETAMCYLNLGGYEDAVAYFEKVLAIPYEPRDIYFNYGKALWGARQFDKASDALQKHLKWIESQGADYQPTPGATKADVYLFLADSYFYRKPADYASAVENYNKAFAADSTNKRVLQNLAVSYQLLQSYQQALQFYDRRIALGIDSANSSMYKNAGSCAYALASGSKEDDAPDSSAAPKDSTTTALSSKDYFRKGADYYEKYLQYNPNDGKTLSILGSIYLYQLNDCTNGIKCFERALTIDPTDCSLKRSMGFAYFGDTGCGKNYTKALEYLNSAYECTAKAGGSCKDVDLTLWIAQCYHLRAGQKGTDKAAASADYKLAFEWYGRVLKCEPGNKTALDGQNNTRYEFK